jgi:predicted dehydrogenase
MSKIGLGIVGGGTIALRVLRHLVQPDVAQRVSLAAICDPVADRARAAADKFGIARCFTDYQELLACDEVNAVMIASPINFHFEQVRQALLASKHVHCNKTMATTGAEARELTQLARERNLRLVPSPGCLDRIISTSKK